MVTMDRGTSEGYIKRVRRLFNLSFERVMNVYLVLCVVVVACICILAPFGVLAGTIKVAFIVGIAIGVSFGVATMTAKDMRRGYIIAFAMIIFWSLVPGLDGKCNLATIQRLADIGVGENLNFGTILGFTLVGLLYMWREEGTGSIKLTRTSAVATTITNRRAPWALRFLGAFAWFCSKPNREIIEAINADLKKDAKDMHRKKHGEFFVQCVLLWHVGAKTILPMTWDGLRRLLNTILPIETIIKKFRGF